MSDNLNNTSLLGLALEKTELFVYSSAVLLIDGQLVLNDSRITNYVISSCTNPARLFLKYSAFLFAVG